MTDYGDNQLMTGRLLETGELVIGEYCGSYWWNPGTDRCERANLRVHGRIVTVTVDSLGPADEG